MVRPIASWSVEKPSKKVHSGDTWGRYLACRGLYIYVLKSP